MPVLRVTGARTSEVVVHQGAQVYPLIDATYREALSLTREARDFLQAHRGKRSLARDASDVLLTSCETMRMTSRLTQVMAWLMVQKAVHAGEISREDAAQPEYRLGGQEVCSQRELPFEGTLAPALQDLMTRSLRLYERVERLDAMHDQAEP